MLRRLAQESGMAMMRTEKAGVGDSEGDCAALDYKRNSPIHRAALAALRRSPDVDPERIVVFGASMGGNYAPLVAAGEPVAGVMIWGGGAKTWFERMLGFERRAKKFARYQPAELDSTCTRSQRTSSPTCSIARTPRRSSANSRRSPAPGRRSSVRDPAPTTAGRLRSTSRPRRRTGPRPGAHRRARARAYGEYDWFEDAAAHRLVADIANRRGAGRGEFVEIPATDHHFDRFPDAGRRFAARAA